MTVSEGSFILRAFFVVLPIVLVLLTVWGVWHAARRCGEPAATARSLAARVLLLAVLWLASTWAIASTGLLLDFDRRPPPFAVIPPVMVGLGVWLARSRVGALLARGLPLAVLVGFQAFRVPLELMMHEAALQGVMPAQMSFAGYNFDILTGITAAMLGVTLAFRPVSRGVVMAWNVMGLLLLTTIVVIAIVSTPVIGAFGAERYNLWVMTAPYVSLPAVMVLCAWAGHLVVFRALAEAPAPRSGARDA